jgi:hypothetical protein
MDTTLLAVVAIVVVIAIVAYVYREEIGLKFKGWGIQAALHAKGGTKSPPGSRNVSIGGN